MDSPELLGRLSPAQIFDSLAIRVNGPEAWDERIVLDIALSDLDETHRLSLRNGVLIHRRRIDRDGPADATIRAVTTLRLLALLAGDDASPASRSPATRRCSGGCSRCWTPRTRRSTSCCPDHGAGSASA
ncbi:alkyl sulfatase C-terminal domain-containing protein [Leucobacter soli]|uniref:alkyl sulfatase C-terminal domain-containing protein n=1 Tax=Leucobacter soli TaxID=2812850 RepID=UPI003608ADEB